MMERFLTYLIVFAPAAWYLPVGFAQEPRRYIDAHPQPTDAIRTALLPTDRTLEMEGGAPSALTIDPGVFPSEVHRERPQRLPGSGQGRPNLSSSGARRSLRPRLGFQAEWEPQVDGLAISSYDFTARMPVYPIFGPPPPSLTAGYSLTSIDSPAGLDLPDQLHDVSLGGTWIRPINDKWMARLMLSAAFASDLDNTSSEAWQIRGGGFAMYRPNPRWTWAFGAVATGRDDIPVLPAIGAIWEPSERLRVDLMMPRPRISRMLFESGRRQHWGYVGMGFSGGTWAYERASGLDDRLTYRGWRVVLGWESMPRRPPSAFRSTGTKLNAEIGYVFGRTFEFDSSAADVDVADALLLRTGIQF